VIGRPILYKTTREFLLRFGLNDVSELPSMEEFEKMAATELDMEPETAEEDRPVPADSVSVDDAEPEGEPGDNGSRLESNSQSGEELAAASEAKDAPDSIAKETTVPPENEELERAPADSTTTSTADPESTRNPAESASSDSQSAEKIEAPHAQEIQKEP
jgi:segregation and condensation protein B